MEAQPGHFCGIDRSRFLHIPHNYYGRFQRSFDARIWPFLALSYSNRDLGTYKYQGRWNAIDGGIANFPVQVQACDLPLLLQKDTKWGGLKPLRRWQGNFIRTDSQTTYPFTSQRL